MRDKSMSAKINFAHHQKPCCLIAEDTPEIQKYYSVVFDKMDLDYIIANNGLEAIEILKEANEAKFEFDLFVIDLIMPKIDGIQVLEEIRSYEQYKESNIFIVSAIHNQAATDGILKNFEPNTTFYKPIDTDDFLAKVRKAVGK
jgi:CheY-like chemotaxis protein